MNPDTPLPQEEPAGENPPDGAIIDYHLNQDATTPVTLDITDAAGKPVRHFSSSDTLYTIPDVNIPQYWIRPRQLLSAHAGPHRFIWDLHYQPLNVPASYPISAVYANTAPVATSPWVMPGTYTLKLTVNGKVYTQKITVRMDPRVKTPLPALQQQHDLAVQACKGRESAMAAFDQIHALRAKLAKSLSAGSTATGLQELDTKLAALEGAGRRGGRGAAAPTANGPKSYSQLLNDFAGLFTVLEEADLAPTTQAIEGLQSYCASHAQQTNAALAAASKTNCQPSNNRTT